MGEDGGENPLSSEDDLLVAVVSSWVGTEDGAFEFVVGIFFCCLLVADITRWFCLSTVTYRSTDWGCRTVVTLPDTFTENSVEKCLDESFFLLTLFTFMFLLSTSSLVEKESKITVLPVSSTHRSACSPPRGGCIWTCRIP